MITECTKQNSES